MAPSSAAAAAAGPSSSEAEAVPAVAVVAVAPVPLVGVLEAFDRTLLGPAYLLLLVLGVRRLGGAWGGAFLACV